MSQLPGWDNGGNVDLVRAMGFGAVRRRRTKRTAFRATNAARDTLNGLIAVVTYGDENARVSNTLSPTQRYGHSGGQLWVKLGAAANTNVASADEAVDKGVLWALPQSWAQTAGLSPRLRESWA